MILVDEITVSAAEFFVGGLKDIGRAKVVGDTPTAGATHAPNVETLPGGARLGVSNHNVYDLKGNSYEGIGIMPDVLVKTTVEAVVIEASGMRLTHPCFDRGVSFLSSAAAHCTSARAPTHQCTRG